MILGFQNVCLIHNGGCEDECKLDASGAAICSCYPGREVLLSNPKRCIEARVSRDNGTCDGSGTQFECSTGSCIPFELTCDGVKHCEDGSDEMESYCTGLRVCIDGYFKCTNNRCIPVSKICNFVNDCGDNSDEYDK